MAKKKLNDNDLFDLEDLIEETNDNDWEDEKPKKKAKPAKKQVPKPKERPAVQKKGLSTGAVIGIAAGSSLLFSVFGVGLGLLLGGSNGQQTAPQQQQPQTVQTTPSSSGEQIKGGIKKVVPLEQRVDSIKDAQIKSLQAQIADLKIKNGSSSDANISGHGIILNSQLAKVTNEILTNYFDVLLADNPNKTDMERFEAYKPFWAIQDAKHDQQESEESKAVRSNLTNFVSNTGSIMKHKKGTTAKAGSPFISLVGVGHNNMAIYQVVVPVVDEDQGEYNAVYIVRLNDGNLITAMTYVGFLKDNVNTKSYYDAITHAVNNSVIKEENKDEKKPQETSNLPQNSGQTETEQSSTSDSSSSSSSESSSTEGSSTTIETTAETTTEATENSTPASEGQ